MNEKTIICIECNKRISRKTDLAVAGSLMQPYHTGCLENPHSSLGRIHRFTGQCLVGFRFWLVIILGNIFMGELLRRHPESLVSLIVFCLVCNIVFIGARIGIYYSYERYLS